MIGLCECYFPSCLLFCCLFLSKFLCLRFILFFCAFAYWVGPSASPSTSSPSNPKLLKRAKLAANWLTSELFGRLYKLSKGTTEEDEDESSTIATVDTTRKTALLHVSPVTAIQLSQIIDLIQDGVISGKIGKQLLDLMFEGDKRSAKVKQQTPLNRNNQKILFCDFDVYQYFVLYDHIVCAG